MPDLSIPQADRPFLEWARAFHRTVAANPSRYAMSVPDVDLIGRVVGEYIAAYDVTIHEGKRTKVSVREKDSAKVAAMQVMRMFVRQIQADNGISDASKVDLRLHIRSRVMTPRQVPQSSPVLHYIGSTPLSHTLEYSDPFAGGSKRKPHGAESLQLFMAIGDEPERDPRKAQWVGAFTHWRFAVLHEVENARKVVSYFGQWMGHRKDVGPWSLPIHAVVPWVSGGAMKKGDAVKRDCDDDDGSLRLAG
jgi:hypothetical protein